MNPTRKTSTVAKVAFLLSLACIASTFLIYGILGIGVAKSQEREFDNQVPKHLPIKVKIKKEKENAVKDMKNEKWVRDFELEVTNTGDKPIYYLSLLIVLPGVTIPNGTDEMGFSLHFGRKELFNIETKAEPDDISIKPGETYVFSLPDIQVMGWERFRKREKKPDATKLILHFQLLSFGDGTGFVRNDGVPVPHAPDTKSSLDRCSPVPNFSDSGGMKAQPVSWRNQPATFSTNDLPANFLLANFLSPESSKPTSLKPNPQPQFCCSGNGCSRAKPYLRDCFCDPEGKDALAGTSCSDPLGGCYSYTIMRISSRKRGARKRLPTFPNNESSARRLNVLCLLFESLFSPASS